MGLPQASPNEEDLDTIAEEPTVETQASQTQFSHPQALEKPLETAEQQQTSKQEEGLGGSDVRPRDVETGSHAQGSQDVSQAAGVAGNVGNDGDAGEEAHERMDTDERGKGGHSDSHAPSERPRRSLAGSQLQFFKTLRVLSAMLGWAACEVLTSTCDQQIHSGQGMTSQSFAMVLFVTLATVTNQATAVKA